MKIAIISSGFLPVVDGVTISLLNRLQKLSELGHQVLVLCPDYQAIAQIYPDWQNYVGEILPNVRVVSLASTPFMGMDFERNVNGSSYKTLIQELKHFQPDIIHVDEPDRLFLGFGKIPGIDFAKQHHIPCVSFLHTIFLLLMDDFIPLPPAIVAALKQLAKRLITRRVFNAYDATLVAGDTTYQTAVDIGLTNVVKGNFLGVNSDQFHPQLRSDRFFQEKYGLPAIHSTVKLIFLGRLTPEKGWKFTISAFTKMAKANNLKNLALIIAGDGPMHNEIDSKLRLLGLEVHFLGRIAHDQVPALLANSDIHVTTCDKETRGLTILEAAAAGIPVIAPRSGGVVDSIRDGWNGLLFNPGDEQDFVDQLLSLAADSALRQSMGRNGREDVMQYSWNHAVQCLLEFWQTQIEKYSV
jgi:glycosyltransferase involved in cell wall biosynthesis